MHHTVPDFFLGEFFVVFFAMLTILAFMQWMMADHSLGFDTILLASCS